MKENDDGVIPINPGAERDRRIGEVVDNYRRARIELEHRRVFGRPIDLRKPDAPNWLPEDFDETHVVRMRQEMIDTLNEYKPAEGWAYPDGRVVGDWRELPQDPEKLAEWVDDDVSAKLAEIAAGVAR